MELQIKYQGRIITASHIEFIKQLINKNPHDSRRCLSKKLCQQWDWRQTNGVLKDMVCRGLMLHLARAGFIKLPPIKFRPNNPLAHRKQPPKVEVDKSPLCYLSSQIKIVQVRRTGYEALFNSLISQYHYLGYAYPIGEYLKYIYFLDERPIACIALCSAPRHIKCRDQFIGWSQDIRKKNIQYIAYNTRFLILPWVKIYCLASRLLSRIVKIISADWEKYYNHPLYFLETFVDTERFKGTCYHAANWIYLGDTTGRGKNDQTHKINRSIKAVWGYPLSKNFRELLQNE
ncbi:MAG TPA: DUF4338 domain-containing protein [Ignavibacteria bacterium]|nr:DUF4338 domain-containing protein [Ignavibacteria bacterium]